MRPARAAGIKAAQLVKVAKIKAARGARVVVECQPALLPLLEGSAGVDQWLASPVDAVPAADFQLPMMRIFHVATSYNSSLRLG
jgi:hypothetical protein